MLRDLAEQQGGALGPDHIDVLTTRHQLVLVLAKQQKFEEGESISRDLVAAGQRSRADSRIRGLFLLDHGRCLTGLARLPEAEQDLIEAERMLRGAVSKDHPLLKEAGASLAALYDAWKRPDDAARWRSVPAVAK